MKRMKCTSIGLVMLCFFCSMAKAIESDYQRFYNRVYNQPSQTSLSYNRMNVPSWGYKPYAGQAISGIWERIPFSSDGAVSLYSSPQFQPFLPSQSGFLNTEEEQTILFGPGGDPITGIPEDEVPVGGGFWVLLFCAIGYAIYSRKKLAKNNESDCFF